MSTTPKAADRCPRRASGQHHWRPGPVLERTIEQGDFGRQYAAVTHIALVCECGAIARREAPRELTE